MSIISFIIFIAVLAGMWKIFEKAGEPGWAGIIPIYNIIVLTKIVNKPIWWVVLLLIPVVNVVVAVILLHRLAKSFGQGVPFTVGLILLSVVFIPLLGFGDFTFKKLAS